MTTRDELAGVQGWVRAYSTFFHAEVWRKGDTELRPGDHPVPDTYDEAMRLPEGWEWKFIGKVLKYAAVVGRRDFDTGMWIEEAEWAGEDLKSALFAAQLAARKHK